MRVHYKNKRNYGVSVQRKKKTNSSGKRVHYGKPKENYGVSVHRGKEQWGESSPKKKRERRKKKWGESSP